MAWHGMAWRVREDSKIVAILQIFYFKRIVGLLFETLEICDLPSRLFSRAPLVVLVPFKNR